LRFKKKTFIRLSVDAFGLSIRPAPEKEKRASKPAQSIVIHQLEEKDRGRTCRLTARTCA
jgi:hypothetical protein